MTSMSHHCQASTRHCQAAVSTYSLLTYKLIVIFYIIGSDLFFGKSVL